MGIKTKLSAQPRKNGPPIIDLPVTYARTALDTFRALRRAERQGTPYSLGQTSLTTVERMDSLRENAGEPVTAKEAMKTTQDARKHRQKEVIKYLEEHILRAAQKGYANVSVNFESAIPPEVLTVAKQHLQEHGYEVHTIAPGAAICPQGGMNIDWRRS